MRPQRNATSARILRHLGDVAIEGFDVEEERRRVERGTTSGLADQAAVRHNVPSEFLG